MRIWISLPSQLLELYGSNDLLVRRFPVSTATNGAGEQRGSYRTPRGRHLIRAKIGAAAPANAVFVRRRPTGEVWSPELAADHPGRDWILSRILWLSGQELGRNRGGDKDTMRRYIYLHGSPDTVTMGTPGSIGCVRMRNSDIIELFDLVPPYTPVDIVEFGLEDGDWTGLGPEAGPLREAVFVQEQGVPLELEYDAADPVSRHVLARGPDGAAIGTGRLLADGHIGRMAVAPAWRGQGVGRALMCRLLDMARRSGMEELALNAQVPAVGFYRRLGFRQEGQEFLDAGLPHVAMRRCLSA